MQNQTNRTAIVPYPTLIQIDDKCNGIVAGSFHSYAFSDRQIYFWGEKHACSLGVAEDHKVHANTQKCGNEEMITIDLSVEHISTGKSHTFAWNDKKVYCWGTNQYYELGLDQEQDYGITNMQILEKAIQKGYNLGDLSCGQHHTLAVFRFDDAGHKEADNESQNLEDLQIYQNQEEDQQNAQIQLFSWGQSSSYQLTINTLDIIPYPVISPCTFKSLDKVYSKSDYNIALCKGKVYSWGCNLFSRLGQVTHSSQLPKVRIPREVLLPEKVVKIGIGVHHVVAVTQNGNAYSWGKGNQGQLGIDKLELESKPTKVICEYSIKDACCGESHTLVVLADSRLMSCGSNSHGVLGHPSFEPGNKKKKVKKLQFVKADQEIGQIVEISCGSKHNLVLNKKGQVFGWGDNEFYQVLAKQKPLLSHFLQDSHRMPDPELSNISQNSLLVAPQLRQNCKNVQEIHLSKLQDWKRRYNAFKQAKSKEQQLFMHQFEQIMQQLVKKSLD